MSKISDKINTAIHKYFWAYCFLIIALISLELYHLIYKTFLMFVAGFFTGMFVYVGLESRKLND
jgi:hypothetical protein